MRRGRRPGRHHRCTGGVHRDGLRCRHACAGRFLVWDLRPGGHDVTGHVPLRALERESNPRHSVFNRCSTRLSYPVVDEPDSNRWPTACAAALPLSFRPLVEHRLPIPGIRHSSAARTGWALRTHAAVDRSSDVPHWRFRDEAKAPIRVRLHPLAARAEASRHGASLRLRGVSLPRASNARMLRERDAIAFDRMEDPFANAGNETPPGAGTRGRSRGLGRSG